MEKREKDEIVQVFYVNKVKRFIFSACEGENTGKLPHVLETYRLRANRVLRLF